MADVADNADDLIEREQAEGIRKAAENAAKIPQGSPGECEWCGEYFARLVGGACGRCRDHHRLD